MQSGLTMEPPSRATPLARRAATIAGLVLVLLVGWIDFRASPAYTLTLLYLVPIVACAWWVGVRSASIVAFVATILWIAAELHWRPPDPASIWSDFTHWAIFFGTGILVAKARLDGLHLASLNERLNSMLAREATLARTDSLTGLPNQRWFMEILRSEVARSQRDGHPICVVYLDVDDLKGVNDVHGHFAGDALLQAVASEIRAAVRAGDTPARIGGDEFAILLWNLDRGAAEGVAGRLIEQIRDLGRLFPRTGVGASAGVAFFERPPDDIEEILRRADSAMYRAKTSGKSRLVVWSQAAGEALAKG